MTQCPDCNGTKTTITHWAPGATRDSTCRTCNGKRTITAEQAARISEGNRRRNERIDRGVTLREEAARLGMHPRDLSLIENGMEAA